MDRNGSLLNIDRALVSDAATTHCSKDNIVGWQALSHLPYQQLIANINTHTTILTTNNRLATLLHQQYDAVQIAKGLTTWETPDIIPAMTWMQRCWSDYTTTTFDSTPHLLSNIQEQALWEVILSQAKEFPNLLQLAESAKTAQAAWRLLKQYNISLDHSLLRLTDAYSSMHDWATTFQLKCQQSNFIDNASMPTLLATHIASGDITLPQTLTLVGMAELTPQLHTLIAACEKQGCNVQHYALPHKAPTHIQRCHAEDSESEILLMARWAKAIQNIYPTASIGCVVPKITSSHNRVEQIFGYVFNDTEDESLKKTKSTYSISASKPLSNYPIIQAALRLLKSANGIITATDFNYLLATPYLGEAENERGNRANFDKTLRRKNIISLTLDSIINDTSKDSLQSHCPQLTKRFQSFKIAVNNSDVERTHAEWVSVFTNALHALGWPGERTISNIEYQTVKRWLAMLSDYKKLDQVSSCITYTEAVTRLKELAHRTQFQPQAPEAAIQVISLQEAVGLPFDYLWVSGMDDMSWPPAPKPNAFISKQLQREVKMPQATANMQLAASENMMEQFANAAGTLIYSHALKSDDIELETSPLIRAYPEMNVKSLTLSPYHSAWERIFASSQLDILTDATAPAIASDVTSVGGISIIKNQAICPFKAFAEHRLHAREMEIPVAGLRSTDRGNMIHLVMESIWIELKTHAALVQLSDSELHDTIDRAIRIAIQSSHNSRANYQRYTQLEQKRLKKLIWQWFQIEKARMPFVVSANELKANISLDQLTFACKIDRIDTLDDGRSLVIDYKTGKHNDYKLWFGDRPEEPQLPIYALSNPGIAAIAYAQINRSELTMSGIGDNDVDIKGIKQIADIKLAAGKSWQDQLTEWEVTLTRLATDFVNGVARVDPKEKIKSCEFCTLQPLCRIHEETHHAD